MKHVVITIGREYGSGGRLIAKQLSEELGITFYDKELITAVARKTGFSENFIRDSEHQRPTNSFLYDLYTAVQTPSVPDQVFIAQAKVIKEAASRESCVIVGRCADYILRDDPRRLSVLCTLRWTSGCAGPERTYGVQEPNLEAYVLPPGQGPRLLLQLLWPPGNGARAGNMTCASAVIWALPRRWPPSRPRRWPWRAGPERKLRGQPTGPDRPRRSRQFV
mgnify:CR=1 FL=1